MTRQTTRRIVQWALVVLGAAGLILAIAELAARHSLGAMWVIAVTAVGMLVVSLLEVIKTANANRKPARHSTKAPEAVGPQTGAGDAGVDADACDAGVDAASQEADTDAAGTDAAAVPSDEAALSVDALGDKEAEAAQTGDSDTAQRPAKRQAARVYRIVAGVLIVLALSLIHI